MKKFFLLVPVAALAMTACTSESNEFVGDSQQQAREITFSPLSQKATRAAGISNTNYGYVDGTAFNTSWGMTVSAYDVTHSRQLFDGTNFKYNYANGASGASHGYWAGEEDKAQYWPLSAAQINFLAIAHANVDNSTGVTWTQNNTPTHQVVVVMSDNYAIGSAQRDFMYAIGSGEVTQVGNVLGFPEKVDMSFKHTQAYLVFNLKAADAASTAITITDVKIKGARTSGTATIARTNAGTYNDAATSLYWESTGYHTNASTLESVTATQTAISTALTQSPVEMGHLLVVPNMTAANTFAEGGFTSFEISYTLAGNAYTYEYTPATTLLQAGKKYIYDITFKLHEIYVNPSVTDWEDGGTTFVEVPPVNIAAASASPSISVSKDAGTYTFFVTGLTSGDAIGVSKTDASSIIDGDPVLSAATADANGVATITFKMKANTGAARSATITLTDTTDGTKTTSITINQAAGA